MCILLQHVFLFMCITFPLPLVYFVCFYLFGAIHMQCIRIRKEKVLSLLAHNPRLKSDEKNLLLRSSNIRYRVVYDYIWSAINRSIVVSSSLFVVFRWHPLPQSVYSGACRHPLTIFFCTCAPQTHIMHMICASFSTSPFLLLLRV